MKRLKNAHFGQWVDPSKTIRFTFEGKLIQGLEGDTVASALLANEQWVQSRSFKYHRSRGPLTLCGYDANTLVQTPTTPNLLADRLPAEDHLAVKAQNYTGSLHFDLSRLLDWFGRFLPVGFYYKAFFKPRGIWAWWEPIVRKAAGLGISNLTVKAPYNDKTYAFADIAVIGSGPAGLNAALLAANAGAQVTLVEQEPHLGGSMNFHAFEGDFETTKSARDALVAAVETHENIEVLYSSTCNAWFGDHYLPIIQKSRLIKLRARQTILTSGSSEQHVVFRNNDLPGVVMCSALDRLMRLYGVVPSAPIVVVAGNDLAYRTAFSSQDGGAEVAAIVDLRHSCNDAALSDEANRRKIALFQDCGIYEAKKGLFNHRLSQVDVHKLDERGEVAEKLVSIDCGLLAMSAGFMPSYQLACQAGAVLSYDDSTSQFQLSNLPGGMHLAGSVNSVFSLDLVEADGRNAARRAVSNLGIALESDMAESEDVSCTEQVNHPWPFLKHPKGREFVDFDEDLQIKDIINATRMGYRDIQLVKRFSTVGMGPSQGRHSALPTARLVAKTTDRTVHETGVTTARPPLMPEPLGLLAGRRFHPLRRTPLHHRHLELGAQMMPAGSWQRPAYYGEPAKRTACIQAEVTAVRQGAGIIDVSTLGGIELRGPDAPEFMNRLYTFGFVKQPIGKTRYAVLTDELGVVVDDGVAARLGEHHYYVTATSSGVDRVYRDMLRWNAQWRLDLDIANVTSAFSAINVAGPLSRQVIESVGCSVDLSADHFPYLACREALVADIPARIMRVGFVGELGYELHVPSPLMGELWDRLLTAGQTQGIRPFGVETQRLLRLEKGHIIVGQDTDGMTQPDEVSLRWAIASKKPFFVGSKSVDILSKSPLERQLVGFELGAASPQPKEGHLVIRNGDIVGSVTSCEYSPTLDNIIGLAYVHPEDSVPGTTVIIRTDDAVHVHAQVAATPFYDPDNLRQAL
jgi:sarcosine oxidase subunit alpha